MARGCAAGTLDRARGRDRLSACAEPVPARPHDGRPIDDVTTGGDQNRRVGQETGRQSREHGHELFYTRAHPLPDRIGDRRAVEDSPSDQEAQSHMEEAADRAVSFKARIVNLPGPVLGLRPYPPGESIQLPAIKIEPGPEDCKSLAAGHPGGLESAEILRLHYFLVEERVVKTDGGCFEAGVGVDEPIQARPIDGAEAHRTRLRAGVDRAP